MDVHSPDRPEDTESATALSSSEGACRGPCTAVTSPSSSTPSPLSPPRENCRLMVCPFSELPQRIYLLVLVVQYLGSNRKALINVLKAFTSCILAADMIPRARKRLGELISRQVQLPSKTCLYDLIQSFKVLVAKSENHPARMSILPPAPDGNLTRPLHLASQHL